MAKSIKKTKRTPKQTAKNILDIATGKKKPPVRKLGEHTPKKKK